MKEIEVKFRVKNFKTIIPILKKLGMKQVWKGKEKNFFLDTPSMTLKKMGAGLRVREWGGHSKSITLKTKGSGDNKKYKVRNEHQVIIDDIRAARGLLKGLGFSNEYLRYEKYREHWKREGVSVELDILKGMHFVEIEASKAKITQLAEILGLDWAQSTTQSYTSMLQSLAKSKY